MGYIKKRLPQEIGNIFVFTFVRNPLDRIVSLYRNKFLDHQKISQDGFVYENYLGGIIGCDDDFLTFCRKISKIPDKFADGHFKSQSALVYSNNHKVDFIGKFESFNSDFELLINKIGLNTPSQSNKTNSVIPSPEITEEIRALVYARYEKDYKNFYPEIILI